MKDANYILVADCQFSLQNIQARPIYWPNLHVSAISDYDLIIRYNLCAVMLNKFKICRFLTTSCNNRTNIRHLMILFK